METSTSKRRTREKTPEMDNLQKFLKKSKYQPLGKRIKQFSTFLKYLAEKGENSYFRLVSSPQEREVIVKDRFKGTNRKMLMFASNNYLGLANHPYVTEKVVKAMNKYGSGLGGPPLLNGYTLLMQQLEERLAHLKHQESAMVFSSGYSTNLGLVTGLIRKNDMVICDQFCHASFFDGIRLGQISSDTFAHNNLKDLDEKLCQYTTTIDGTLFVGMEGVYSVDGDLAPLDRMVPLLKKYKAISLLDDAHGTGVLGRSGSGTAEYFNQQHDIDISMGTFSKSLAMTGGFLAASRDMINYLRYFARSYMFSAALPPIALAAVIAGLDVIEKEPWRRQKLIENRKYTAELLKDYTFAAPPQAAIISLRVPMWMDIRKANYLLHQNGIFLNAIEYPSVPADQQRFRISLMTQHTKEDMVRLAEAMHKVWKDDVVKV
jgi:glycine C-acetyltransferase